MGKKYIRPGGMCQFFDEHFSDGDVDLNRLGYEIFHGTKDKYKPNEETYSSKMAQIIGECRENTESKKQKKEEIPYNNNYKTF